MDRVPKRCPYWAPPAESPRRHIRGRRRLQRLTVVVHPSRTGVMAFLVTALTRQIDPLDSACVVDDRIGVWCQAVGADGEDSNVARARECRDSALSRGAVGDFDAVGTRGRGMPERTRVVRSRIERVEPGLDSGRTGVKGSARSRHGGGWSRGSATDLCELLTGLGSTGKIARCCAGLGTLRCDALCSA